MSTLLPSRRRREEEEKRKHGLNAHPLGKQDVYSCVYSDAFEEGRIIKTRTDAGHRLVCSERSWWDFDSCACVGGSRPSD